MDNRHKDKNPILEEIENDTNPINEGEQPRVDEDGIETPDSDEEVLAIDNEDDPENPPAVEKGYDPSLDDPEESATPKVKPEAKPDVDERLKQSTREAQLLHERNQQVLSAVEQAKQVAEPTEDELRRYVTSQGGEFDMLTQFERNLAKNTLIAEKRFNIIDQEVSQVKKIDEWASKVDGFIEENDSKQSYKDLMGRETDFRAFAMKATHRGLPLTILVSSFLYETPAPTKQKGSLFATGSSSAGKPANAVKDGIVDADQAAALRQSNPKEYARLSKLGKIKVEI